MSCPEPVEKFQVFDSRLLDAAGLNLQAIFNIADLPPELVRQLGDSRGFRQLVLIGHGGPQLWRAVQAAGLVSQDPIDDFTVRTVNRWCAEQMPGQRYAIIYPGSQTIALQVLGQLAGWHHTSPFMVGINARWGSWYAYRAVLLTDTAFAPLLAAASVSPCLGCSSRACIIACPGDALADANFSVEKCIGWRTQVASSCRETCLARLSCPVAIEQRYPTEQLRHSYAASLKMIAQYVAG